MTDDSHLKFSEQKEITIVTISEDTVTTSSCWVSEEIVIVTITEDYVTDTKFYAVFSEEK